MTWPQLPQGSGENLGLLVGGVVGHGGMGEGEERLHPQFAPLDLV